MKLFGSGMKFYTVHLPSGVPDAQERAEFVREGFNWLAFFFHFLWAFYHRLWLPACLIMAAFISFGMLAELGWVSETGLVLLQLGISVIIGFHGNDWLRSRLARRGYILADISASDSEQHAEQRYFDRQAAARGL